MRKLKSPRPCAVLALLRKGDFIGTVFERIFRSDRICRWLNLDADEYWINHRIIFFAIDTVIIFDSFITSLTGFRDSSNTVPYRRCQGTPLRFQLSHISLRVCIINCTDAVETTKWNMHCTNKSMLTLAVNTVHFFVSNSFQLPLFLLALWFFSAHHIRFIVERGERERTERGKVPIFSSDN